MDPVADTPSSADAWNELHRILKDKGSLREFSGPQDSSVHSILTSSLGELSRKQQGRFLKLGVLANGVMAPLEMMCCLWDEEVRNNLFGA